MSIKTILLAIFIPFYCFSQVPGAVLELEADDAGLLLSRIELISTSDHNPLPAHVEGMIVYNTIERNDVSPGLYINDGLKWINISEAIELIDQQKQQIEALENGIPIKRAIFVAGQSNTTFGIGSAQIPDFSCKKLFQLGRLEDNLSEVPLSFYGAHHHTRYFNGGNFGSIFVHHYHDYLQTQYPDREIQILMVPCGSGGSGWAAAQHPVNSWRTDAAFYNDVINRIKWVKNQGYQIDAFLWHQGETDAIGQTVNYKDLLYNFIQSIRDFADNQNLPFILGEMVPSWVASVPTYQIYQDIINEVKNEIPFTGVASGDSLSLADAIHYDADAHIQLGQRYFDEYLNSLQNTNPTNYNPIGPGDYVVYNFDSSSGVTFPDILSAIRFGNNPTDVRFSELGDIWKYKNIDGYHFKLEVLRATGIQGGIFEWKQKFNPFGLNEDNFEDRAAFEIINNTVGIDPNIDQRFASLVYDAQADGVTQLTLFHADVRAFNNFWFFPIGQVANFGNLIPLVQSNNSVSHVKLYMIKD